MNVCDFVVCYFVVQIALIFCRVWSEQSASSFVWICFVLSRQKLYVGMIVCIS